MSFRLPFLRHHRHAPGEGAPSFLVRGRPYAGFYYMGENLYECPPKTVSVSPAWSEYTSREHLESAAVEALMDVAETSGTLLRTRDVREFLHHVDHVYGAANARCDGLIAHPHTTRTVFRARLDSQPATPGEPVDGTLYGLKLYSCSYMPEGLVLAVPEPADLGIVATRPVNHLRFYASILIWGGRHLAYGTPGTPEPRTVWERLLE